MAKKRKSVEIEIPEIADLPLDPETRIELDTLCSQVRALSAEIKFLEEGDPEHDQPGKKDLADKIRKIAVERGLPGRVLGDGWDLRRAERVFEKVNEARLKMRLLQTGFTVEVSCPKVVEQGSISLLGRRDPMEIATTQSLIVCPFCDGTGVRVLEGMAAADALVAECTDRSESVSWAVWPRAGEKAPDPCPVCGLPLVPNPSGAACANGHGFGGF